MNSNLLRAGLLLTCWGLATAILGGFHIVLFGLRISSRDPFRPCLIGALCAAAYLWKRRREAPLQAGSGPYEYAGSIVVACAAAGAALLWGSFVAGGSDLYGYISQARLWLNGDLHIAQPWAASLPWSDVDWIAAPVGYKPGLTPHTIVPTYPIGLPILIALFQLLGLPMLVVPLLAGITIWVTYLMGRDATGDALAGLVSALVLATSPIFLHQSMWTMADVPTTAFWTLAFWLGAIRVTSMPLAAGLSAGFALMSRPNLALMACVLPAVWMIADQHPWRKTGRFTAALALPVAAVAVVNTFLYGALWVSGYGDVGSLFALGHTLQNLRLYATWIRETQTILFLFAIVLAAASSRRWVRQGSRLDLVSGIAIGAILLSYLFYQPFDAWWYLRFLLPVWPLCCGMIAAFLVLAARHARSRSEAYVVAGLLCSPLVVPSFRAAINLGVFDVGQSERRYIAAATMVADNTPPNAIVIADQHSGSVRFYGNRRTLRFPYIAAASFDDGVSRLSSSQPVYLFLEKWEEEAFRRQFAEADGVKSVNGSPIAKTPDGQVSLFLVSSLP